MNKSLSQHTSRLVFWVIAILIGAILFVAGFILALQLANPDGAAADDSSSYTGVTLIDPARDMPDFTLTDQDGSPLSLSDLRGKFILFTFGFTNCPDICPLTLNEFRRVRDALAEDSANVVFAFISVDGARDTSAVLTDYFRVRNLQDFVGLTGDPEEVRLIGEAYGLYFVYGERDAQGRYNVDHTAGSYLLDPDGRWVARFAYGTDTRLIAEEIATRLRQR